MSLKYFQQKEGMQGVLASWQIKRLSAVFKRDLLKVPELKTELPSWIKVKWEGVAYQTPQGAFFPNEDFLNNLELYRYNKFLSIGKSYHFVSSFNVYLKESIQTFFSSSSTS